MGSQEASPGPAVFLAGALLLGWFATAGVGSLDSGELGAASYTLGVAHPTGFALDMLLLRMGAWLPLGPLALRQNLCVALVSAGALGLLADCVFLIARRAGIAANQGAVPGAVFAAAALGSFQTFLASALEVEVYSTALFVVLAAAALLLRGGRIAGACLLLLGLCAGSHVTAVLFVGLLCAAYGLHSGGLRRLRARWPLPLWGAAVVLYLPIASRRDPPLDWGDPQTPAALLAHLTAQRIRRAYAPQMLSDAGGPAFELSQQLLELWPCGVLAVAALLWALRADRRFRASIAVIILLVAADVLYARFINPMGIAQRQLGHTAGAGLSLLAGLGVARLLHGLRTWPLALLGGKAAVALLIGLWLLAVPRTSLAAGHGWDELYGSGGALMGMPPRAIVLCVDDSACAAGLFAQHVESARPDVTLAPAQHLWDPTVRRQLAPLLGPAPRSGTAAQLGQRVNAAVVSLAKQRLRPLRVQRFGPLRRAGLEAKTRLAAEPPYLRVAGQSASPSPAAGVALARLEALRAARLGDAPHAGPVRLAWAQTFGEFGRMALRVGAMAEGRGALRRAIALQPDYPLSHTSLGVALEAAGELQAALAAHDRARDLDPQNATAWVNGIRLSLRMNLPQRARQLLSAARAAGIQDPRLDRLQAQLDDIH